MKFVRRKKRRQLYSDFSKLRKIDNYKKKGIFLGERKLWCQYQQWWIQHLLYVP